jgi:hippurate hydrolase
MPTVREFVEAELEELSRVYQHLHANPELSGAEVETAAFIARQLRSCGWEVTTGIGGTGVVGSKSNGPGDVVALRADMDALPIREETGLSFASSVRVERERNGFPQPVDVMHACGHDLHMTCLLGVARYFSQFLQTWRGTLLLLFQPAEEIAAGARSMVVDNLWTRFPLPSVVLGQHIDERPAGVIGIREGTTMTAADSLRVRIIGRGGHASSPHWTIDPIVQASATIMRLQTIVSREVSPAELAVVSVGSIRAGEKENIIPAEAEFTVNIRSVSVPVREALLEAVRRIVLAEAEASGTPFAPNIEEISSFPLTVNDPAATATVRSVFLSEFGPGNVEEVDVKMASEDFGLLGAAAGVPSVFWFLGGTDPTVYNDAVEQGRVAELIPSGHSSRFAPAFEPAVKAGVTAFVSASMVWLSPGQVRPTGSDAPR